MGALGRNYSGKWIVRQRVLDVMFFATEMFPAWHSGPSVFIIALSPVFRMKLRLALVVLSCVISVVTGWVLSRSSSTPVSSNKRARPLIGLSLDTLKEERWQRDRDNFVKKAADLGADVKVHSANGSSRRCGLCVRISGSRKPFQIVRPL